MLLYAGKLNFIIHIAELMRTIYYDGYITMVRQQHDISKWKSNVRASCHNIALDDYYG